jgi:hypothetical protein
MSSVTEGRDVIIVAPYDSQVTSVVKEESVPVWTDLGWTVKSDEATPAAAPAPGASRPVVVTPASTTPTTTP